MNAVADAVLRSRAGLASQSRGSSFLFLGPTGVGKTELAKALAELLFDDEKNMVRQPCLEHTVPHAQSARLGRAHGRTGLSLCRADSLHDLFRGGSSIARCDRVQQQRRTPEGRQAF